MGNKKVFFLSSGLCFLRVDLLFTPSSREVRVYGDLRMPEREAEIGCLEQRGTTLLMVFSIITFLLTVFVFLPDPIGLEIFPNFWSNLQRQELTSFFLFAVLLLPLSP